MTIVQSDRGFRWLTHTVYDKPTASAELAGEFGMYRFGVCMDSSFLWIGKQHLLNREEVQQLVDNLQHWLTNGRLPAPVDEVNPNNTINEEQQ